jgi:hypothetical protein
MSQESHSDPLEFVRNMWGSMGFSLPGMVTPTMDVDELEKRIADMKAVEGWLKMNLNMLQMSIQGLELQRATLMTIRHMGDAARRQAEAPEPEEAQTPNPFAAWSAWMNAQAGTDTPAEPEPEPAPEPEAAGPSDAEAGSKAAADAANAFANAAAAATNAAANAAMWPWQLMGEQQATQPAQRSDKPAKRTAKPRATSAQAKPASAATKSGGSRAKKPAAVGAKPAAPRARKRAPAKKD